MQRKIFWLSFIVLSVVLDITLSLLWATIMTLPAVVACWWFAYRSGWFE